MVTLANSALFNLRQSAAHAPVDPAPAYYPQQAQGHFGWSQYGHQAGQPMPSIGMMHAQGQGHAQAGMGTGQAGHDGVRQIGWEEPKKKGWLW